MELHGVAPLLLSMTTSLGASDHSDSSPAGPRFACRVNSASVAAWQLALNQSSAVYWLAARSVRDRCCGLACASSRVPCPGCSDDVAQIGMPGNPVEHFPGFVAQSDKLRRITGAPPDLGRGHGTPTDRLH